MERYLCIHGHFYQPPRENPWLETIELQQSAFPYHDWNDRITEECYAANAMSRILDGEGRIVKIVNNYARISFNFGPTLLSWLEEKRPEVYRAIVRADADSRERFGGHGSAMAQGYGHIILPLSNERDKRTQVLWGIRDFERRFGRAPEGMWLPESAVNTDTLEALAEHGITFTVLAPRQARRSRRLGDEAWTEAGDAAIDPSRAYLQRLPSGRTISLFFYDGPISQAVAFEGLLEAGETFAERLLGAFDGGRDWPQLAHIATDGETYGHHHRHGDMALAYALEHIESNGLATLTNYAQFLERHPPTHEVQIVEDSSWSCVHGVERWKSNCGCSSGMKPEWHQEWRAPLRAALDWLRDTLAPKFERAAGELLTDPWAARDAYIGVLLDRSPDRVDAFLAAHARRELSADERTRVLKLLEMQRQALLMYTSCGWFFDELSGIETVQVMQYAGRALQLAAELFGEDPEGEFMSLLERAPSNVPDHPNGRRVYEDFVKPAFVDLHKVAAHYAISSLFEEYGDRIEIYAYRVEREQADVMAAGRARLLLGRAGFTSRITLEHERLTFGVLHLGDHILNCGVRAFKSLEAYTELLQAARASFDAADYTGLLRIMDTAFGATHYSLRTLFKDEQYRVTDRILSSTMDEVEAGYRQVYENHAPLLRFLAGLRVPPHPALLVAAEFVLNAGLRRAIAADEPDAERIRAALRHAQEESVTLDAVPLGFALETALARAAERVAAAPDDPALLARLDQLVTLVGEFPFEVRLDKAQNACYPLVRDARAEGGATPARPGDWKQRVIELGRKLRIQVE